MEAGPSSKTRSSTKCVATSNLFELNSLTYRQLTLSTIIEDDALAFAINVGFLSKNPGNCPNCHEIMFLYKDVSKKIWNKISL